MSDIRAPEVRDLGQVTFHIEGPLGIVTLNRPEVLNAQGYELLAQVDQAFDLAQAEAVLAAAKADLAPALTIAGKQEREDRLDEIKATVLEKLGEQFEGREKELGAAFRSLNKSLVRERVLRGGQGVARQDELAALRLYPLREFGDGAAARFAAHVADVHGQDAPRVARDDLPVNLRVLLAGVADENKGQRRKGVQDTADFALLKRPVLARKEFARPAPPGAQVQRSQRYLADGQKLQQQIVEVPGA